MAKRMLCSGCSVMHLCGVGMLADNDIVCIPGKLIAYMDSRT